MPPDAGAPRSHADARLAPHDRNRDGVMVEPSWWSDPDAAQERRALTEAFRVGDLEAATADLKARCERLERARCAGQVVTVGQVADILLGQWSVAFHARLADSQRAFCPGSDHDRLARAAEDGRAAAVAVRDRYLAPERISGHSLQQALNLANADASGLRLDRAAVASRDHQSDPITPSPLRDRAAVRARLAEQHARTAAERQTRFLGRSNGRGMSM